MKRPLSLIIVAFFASIFTMFAGCATPSAPKTIPTPAELAAQICPPAQAALAVLAPLSLDPKVAADLAIASTAVNATCGIAGGVNTSAPPTVASLRDLANTALPSIVSAIKASPLVVSKQNELILGVTTANLALNAALASMPVQP